MSPSAPRVGELAHPGGRAMGAQGPWGAGPCRARSRGRSGAERGVWSVGRRGPDPQPLPPRRSHTGTFQARPLQTLPQGQHQSRARLPHPVGPKFLDFPAPSVGPLAPRPPRATVKPRDCMVIAGSVRLQGCLRAPPASSVHAGWGPGFPLRGTCGCVEGTDRLRGPRGLWLWEVCPRGGAQPVCSWGCPWS